MMKKTSKVLALFLSLLMLFSLLPASVFAAGGYQVRMEVSTWNGTVLTDGVTVGKTIITANSNSYFKVNLYVSSETQNSFDAFYAVVKYDAAQFEFKPDLNSSFTVENDAESGTLKISRINAGLTVSDETPALELKFNTLTTACTDFTFTLSSAHVDARSNAENDAPAAELVNATVEGARRYTIEISSAAKQGAESVNCYADGTCTSEINCTQEGQPVWFKIVPLKGYYLKDNYTRYAVRSLTQTDNKYIFPTVTEKSPGLCSFTMPGDGVSLPNAMCEKCTIINYTRRYEHGTVACYRTYKYSSEYFIDNGGKMPYTKLYLLMEADVGWEAGTVVATDENGTALPQGNRSEAKYCNIDLSKAVLEANITVEFVRKAYKLSNSSADYRYGKTVDFDSKKTYYYGDTVELYYQANDGYELVGVKFSRGSYDYTLTLLEDGKYKVSFAMPDKENLSVTAVFKSTASYTVSCTAVGSGTISSSAESARSPEEVTITVTPGEMSYLEKLTMNGEEVEWTKIDRKGGHEGPYSYSFTMPMSEVTVEATFVTPELPWDGSGTEDAPYRIRTYEDMAALRDLVNKGISFSGKFFALENDIDLSEREAKWTPIGQTWRFDNGYVRYHAFSGTFDGQNHTLTYHIDDTSLSMGRMALFGYVVGGTIRNLKTAGSVKIYYYAAGIVYELQNGRLENCENGAEVSSADECAAGVVYAANSNSVVTGCVNRGSVSCGKSTAYGVLSYTSGSGSTTIVSDCKNFGAVTASSGGALGIGLGQTISRCENFGAIRGDSASGIGGAVSEICECSNAGQITAKGSQFPYAQGIGSARKFIDCYNLGTVTVTGTVTSTSKAGAASGITGVGDQHDTSDRARSITNCYNAGTVSSAKGSAVAAIAPLYKSGTQTTVTNSYYLEGSAPNEGAAVSKTSEELMVLAETLGNSFQNVEDSYPILLWQAGSDRIRVTFTQSGSSVSASVRGTDCSAFADGDGNVDVKLDIGGSGSSYVIALRAETIQALAAAKASLELNTAVGTLAFSQMSVAKLAEETGAYGVSFKLSQLTDGYKQNDKVPALIKNGGAAYEFGMYRSDNTSIRVSAEVSLSLAYEMKGSQSRTELKVSELTPVGEENIPVEAGYVASEERVALLADGDSLFGIEEAEKSSPGLDAEKGDLTATVWDGYSVDVSWYLADPTSESFTISTAAQLAGAAAIVNGLVNYDCLVYDGTKWIKAENWNSDDRYVFTGTTDNSGPNGQNKSTETYHYGVDNFNGKTLLVTADLDMSAGNYMPIGGQYLMEKNDYATKLSASFNGTFDGGGHSITVKCDRHCSTGNYGDGSSVGLIGRLGCHDGDPESIWPTTPTVRNVAVYGSIYANRSVGGIVGKIGRTTGFTTQKNKDGALIELCANYASIKNTDAKGCGGIVGAGWNAGIVRNCYNSGSVTSTYACPTGGISGSNEILLENCYSVGTIRAASTSFAMGIGTNNGIAYYDSSVINCWYLEGSAPGGGYYSSGTSYDDTKTSAEMKTLDFVDLMGEAFAMDTAGINNGYPVLGWQASPDAPIGGSGKERTVIIESETTVKNGEATVETTESAVSDSVRAAKEQEADTVVIRTETDGASADSTTVNLPRGGAEKIADEGLKLRFETADGGRFTADADALRSALSQSGSGDIRLVVTKLSGEQAADALQRAGRSAADGDVLEAKLYVDGKEVAELGGTLTVELPAAEGFREGQSYKVIRLAGENGAEELTAKCVRADGKLYLRLTADRLGIFIPLSEPGIPFIDIDGHWGYDSIVYVYLNGLFQGVTETLFAPDMPMTRGMLVTVLYRLEGEPAVTANAAFTDVAEDRWYAKAVAWAAENEIVKGYGTSFGPNDLVTREQMATILLRYAVWKQYDTTAGGMALREYADYAEISGWATAALEWANAEGLILGRTETTIVPQGDATRAEVATILMRFIEKFTK